jgi:protocatechuate 3,4-dioxygenase alpha subunit
VPDGLIETWQADAEGRFDHPDDPRGAVRTPGFRGFGRACTDTDGRWQIRTVRPGRLPGDDADRPQAPHLDVSVFARGLLNRLVTRIYLGDEQAANAADPVLGRLDPDARATLVAVPVDDGFRHDIVLQGEGETVFFRV